MTRSNRLDQQVREAANVASDRKGCNYCHQQRQKDIVKPRKDSRGRVRWICDFCVAAINKLKDQKK